MSADKLDFLFADLFAYRIPVKTQKFRCFDLISVRGRQGRCDQGSLHLAQRPIIKPSRGQLITTGFEIIGEIGFHAFDPILSQGFSWKAELLREIQEVMNEVRNIIETVAQGRHAKWRCVEPA